MSTLADTDGRVLQALLSMVVIDGDADPDELLTLCRAYAELTGRTMAAEELLAQAEALLQVGAPATFEGLAADLDEVGKRCVLAAAYAIAAADGFVLEEEEQLLALMAQGMGLSTQAYRDALAGLLTVRPG